MNLTAGIDVGSVYTKVIVADEAGSVVGKAAMRSGYNYAKAAETGLELALTNAGVSRAEISYVAATGFGRYMVPFRDLAITELTCHGRAAWWHNPQVRTVLDVGGQGVKAIRVDDRGRVKAFRLNDKCAAGSGAFLEKTVRYLGFPMDEIVQLVESAKNPVTVSSVCAVFAESEVINHVSAGTSPEDVAAGAVISLAKRSAQLIRRVKPEPQYFLTGGLSRVPLMRRVLEQEIKSSFQVAEGDLGVYFGAFGAAVLGHERLRRLAERNGA